MPNLRGIRQTVFTLENIVLLWHVLPENKIALQSKRPLCPKRGIQDLVATPSKHKHCGLIHVFRRLHFWILPETSDLPDTKITAGGFCRKSWFLQCIYFYQMFPTCKCTKIATGSSATARKNTIKSLTIIVTIFYLIMVTKKKCKEVSSMLYVYCKDKSTTFSSIITLHFRVH